MIAFNALGFTFLAIGTVTTGWISSAALLIALSLFMGVLFCSYNFYKK